MQVEKLNLVSNWDKVFPKSEKVNHRKVTFPNRFGIILAAVHTDLYDKLDVIPFDKIESFFREYLK